VTVRGELHSPDTKKDFGGSLDRADRITFGDTIRLFLALANQRGNKKKKEVVV
jgi:hypothetical protein